MICDAIFLVSSVRVLPFPFEHVPATLSLDLPLLIPFLLDAMDRSFARNAEIEQELVRLQRDVRNIRRRQSRATSVPIAMWRVATAIFALTHPAVEPPCLYLEQRWQHWQSHHDGMHARLQAWHAHVLASSGMSAVLQPETKEGRRALLKAQTFVQEMQLHHWVENANVRQGIAPRSSVLLHRASTQLPTQSARTLVRPNMNVKYKLQWLRRWRRRWKVGLGPMQPRDFLPVAECQMKVNTKKSCPPSCPSLPSNSVTPSPRE